jgi:hypothetical protein
MTARRFPVLGLNDRSRPYAPDLPRTVSWDRLAPYSGQIERNHSQTMEGLAKRGGLCPEELWAAVTGGGLRAIMEGKVDKAEAEAVVRALALDLNTLSGWAISDDLVGLRLRVGLKDEPRLYDSKGACEDAIKQMDPTYCGFHNPVAVKITIIIEAGI